MITTIFGHDEATETAIQRIKAALKSRSNHLDLGSLPLNKLPAKIDELAPHLTSLDLSECEMLTSLNGIEKLKALTKLDVTGCDALTNLKALEPLTALTTLNAGWCDALTDLEGIDSLTGLTSLDLSGCRAFTSLQEFENLKELISLDVSGADMLICLTGIDQLKALTTLNVSGCQNLTSLEGIQHLKALTMLDATDCIGLKQLNGIEQLTNLAQLYVENSAVDDVSPLTFLLSISTALKDVYLATTPLQRRYNLQLEPSENCLRYIQNLIHQQGSTIVKFRLPAKVLFLGNHTVGKSTLVNLLDETILNLGSTHILQVSPYGTIRQSDAELINLKLPEAVLFDFGGQDYYHGVYRVFMGQHGVTCLLWKTTADFNRYKTDCFGLPNLDFNRAYWLDCLNHHKQQKRSKHIGQTSNSSQTASSKVAHKNPLLLLQTHVEDGDYRQTKHADAGRQHHFSLAAWPSAEHQKSDSQLVGNVQKLYPLDQAAFHHFKAQLDYLIQQQQIEIERSVWYANFLQFILQSHKETNFITTRTADLLTRYTAPGNSKTLKADVELNNHLEAELEQLHKQGLVLYYPDVIRTKVWLNPMTFAKYVHVTILGKERLTNNRGKIPQQEFEQGIDQHILHILQLEKVVFLHRYGGEHGETAEYIVPNYLPLTDPDCAEYQLYTFTLAAPPALSLWFKSYLPLGLINQLVCHFGNLPDYKKFWRDQILFTLDKKGKSGGSLVLIKLVFEEKLQLKIYLQNNNAEQKKRHLGYLYYVLMAMYHNADKIESFEDHQRSIDYFKNTGWVDTSSHVPNAKFKHNDVTLMVLYSAIYSQPPKDLRLSIDGGLYVKATELAELKQQTVLSAVRIDDHKQPSVQIEAYLFAPFMLQKPKKRLRVFISYAHKDTVFREQLQKFFSNMLRANLIEIWHDNKIYAGEPWDHAIKQKLAEADVAVVLTSQDLLASDYIQKIEMPLMIKLHQERRLTILPVLLKDCCFDSWQVAAEQVVNDNITQQNEVAGSGTYTDTFDVSQLQFLPKDDNEQLKPVVEWQPFEEKAWKKVVQALQKLIDAQ